MKDLVRFTAEVFEVDYNSLFLKTRKREIVNARQVCMYVMKEYGNVRPMRLITEYFGMDHATIHYAITATENLCETDKRYREKVDSIVLAYVVGSVFCPIGMSPDEVMPEETLIELQ